MSTRGRLICFTGIDGAGKTTLSKFLSERMTSQGVKYQYVYGRFLPVLVRPFWTVGKLLFLSSKDISGDYSEYTATKKTRLRNPLFARMHEFLLIFDYSLQILAKVTFPLLLGSNLVCDRYVYDTVITDLAPDLGYGDEKVLQMIKFCLAYMPKPDLVFLIDVPEGTSLQRKKDIPDIQYLTDRRGIYSKLKSDKNIVLLSGDLSLDENEHIVEATTLRLLENLP